MYPGAGVGRPEQLVLSTLAPARAKYAVAPQSPERVEPTVLPGLKDAARLMLLRARTFTSTEWPRKVIRLVPATATSQLPSLHRV
jgi:hypothetical protein